MKVFWGIKKSHEFFLQTIGLASSTKYVRTVSQQRWKTSSKKATIKKKQNPGEEADKREGAGKQQAANVLVVQCGMHLDKHTAVRHF